MLLPLISKLGLLSIKIFVMKKILISASLFLSITPSLLAQDNAALRSIRASNVMSTFFNEGTRAGLGAGGTLQGLESSEPIELEGNPYWDEHWGLASVEISGRKELVEGNYVRYDIYRDEVEFNLKDGVKVLPGGKVVSIVWQDSVFSIPRFLVRANQFQENGVPLTGFVEILVDKEMTLLKRSVLDLQQPTYNPALDVGRKNPRIVKGHQYYISINNNLTRLKSKKDIKEVMPNFKSEVENFIKKNSIKVNSENDLIKLVEYYNTLMKEA